MVLSTLSNCEHQGHFDVTATIASATTPMVLFTPRDGIIQETSVPHWSENNLHNKTWTSNQSCN